MRVDDRGLDRIGVRHRDDDAPGVRPPQALQRGEEPQLHLRERLAVGKAEAARDSAGRCATPAAWRSAFSSLPGPVAEVALEQAARRSPPAGCGPVRWRRPSRGCVRAATSRPRRPWPAWRCAHRRPRPGRALVGQVQARVPGRAAGCPWWGLPVPHEEDEWSGAGGLRRGPGHGPTSTYPEPPCPADSLALVTDGGHRVAQRARAWSRGGSRWRSEKRAAFRDEDYWGRPVPGLRRRRGHAARRRACARRPRRQPHRPGLHRRSLRRLGVPRACTRRLREPADERAPRRRPRTSPACTSPRRCAARHRPTGRRRRTRHLRALPAAGARAAGRTCG